MSENEAIARFMGIRTYYFQSLLCVSDSASEWMKSTVTPYSPEDNWNQLMPVVCKIEAMRDVSGFSIENMKAAIAICTELNGPGSKFYWIIENGNSKIETVYKAVVEFVKWHNAQATPAADWMKG